MLRFVATKILKKILADENTRKKTFKIARTGLKSLNEMKKNGGLAKNLGKSLGKLKKKINK